MSALGMLNVAIGIIFVFLLLSLICTAVNEIIENILKQRASDLEKGIYELLQPKNEEEANGLLQKFYTHPLIASLYQGTYKKEGKNLPSYIPASNFALAILDIIKAGAGETKEDGSSHFEEVFINDKGVATTTLKPLRQAILNWNESKAKMALLSLIDAAGNDIDKARLNIENWYNTSMDRVAGWYKRRVQKILILLGFLLAIAMNADTIAILKSLTNDPVLQNSMVAAAQDYAKAETADSTTQSPKDRAQKNIQKLNELRLPIGWDWSEQQKDSANTQSEEMHLPNYYLAIPHTGGGWFLKFIGWLITGLAVSLGAPFWFDTLNKVMVIRSTVKPHEKSPEESSEDRQK